MQRYWLGRKEENGWLALVVILVIAFIVFLAWYIPQQMLKPAVSMLTVQDIPQTSDAIVVLLGSEGPDRILRAYELYKAGFAGRIVFGSGFVDRDQLSLAPPEFVWLPSSALMQAALVSLKFPKKKLTIIDTSDAYDTALELERIAEYSRRAKWKTLILVTSQLHSRRVDMIWRRLAPDIKHFTVSATAPGVDSWWASGRFTRAVVYEYGAMVKEILRQVSSLFTREGEDKNDESVPSQITEGNGQEEGK